MARGPVLHRQKQSSRVLRRNWNAVQWPRVFEINMTSRASRRRYPSSVHPKWWVRRGHLYWTIPLRLAEKYTSWVRLAYFASLRLAARSATLADRADYYYYCQSELPLESGWLWHFLFLASSNLMKVHIDQHCEHNVSPNYWWSEMVCGLCLMCSDVYCTITFLCIYRVFFHDFIIRFDFLYFVYRIKNYTEKKLQSIQYCITDAPKQQKLIITDNHGIHARWSLEQKLNAMQCQFCLQLLGRCFVTILKHVPKVYSFF